MSYSIEQLQAFTMTVETGSFSGAAKQLGKAQSSISTLISNFEINCGFLLFDRTKRTPQLTLAGKSIYKEAMILLRKADNFSALVNGEELPIEKKLNLAIDWGVIKYSLVIDILCQFSIKYPSVKVEVFRSTLNDIGKLLKGGEADIGIMSRQEYNPEGFNYNAIGNTKYVYVAGANHSLCLLQEVMTEDLSSHRQITISNKLSNVRSDIPFVSGRHWYVDSYITMISLIKRDFGWALVPEHLIKYEIDIGNVHIIQPAFQSTSVLSEINIVWTRRHSLGKAGNWLKQQLCELKG